MTRSIPPLVVMPESSPPPEERMTIIQVASLLSIPYLLARSHMLAGDFGPSDYDPVKRKLTVLADPVRKAKAKQDARGKKKKKKRR